MKKILLCLVVLANFVFADRIILDQLGREVSVPDEVNRVVVLQHQSLNLINELDGMGKVVGILESWEKMLGKNYNRLAPTLKNMPTPGDLRTVNYEAILALKPDVVIVANYIPEEHIKKLEELKIPVIGMNFLKAKKGEMTKLNPNLSDAEERKAYDEGFYDGVEIIATLINKEENGKKLIEFVKARQADLAEMTSKVNLKDRKRIYVANPNYNTYGKGKYTGIILDRSGGENVAKKDIKGFSQVSAEKILEWNPDIIFVQERYPNVVKELKDDKKLSSLKAIKDNQIYLLPEFVKIWGHPTAEAMALGEIYIAKMLYPNEFKDYDLDSKIKEFYKEFYRFEYDGK